jgi:hypothetical protein
MTATPLDELESELVLHRRRERALIVVGSGVAVGSTDGAESASWAGLLKDGVAYWGARDSLRKLAYSFVVMAKSPCRHIGCWRRFRYNAKFESSFRNLPPSTST